jgi:hypothetical protein
VDEEVALAEGVVDEAEGLLEVGRHLVAGDVERVYHLVADLLLLRVADPEHGCGGEDWMGVGVPALMFFCLRRARLVAA